MADIVIPLQHAPPIILRSRPDGPAVGFDRLAQLLGVGFVESGLTQPPDFEVKPSKGGATGTAPIFRSASTAIEWDRGSRAFLFFADPVPAEQSDHALVRIWQQAVLFGLTSAILRGSRLLPVHGAWLSTPKGALLLCGESGVGKSTTAQRWRECGYEAPADDLVLLEYGPGGLFVQALPTWSRCMISLAGLRFPVERRERLAGILCLGRGEAKEELLPATGAEFFAQIYRSAFFHVLNIARRLPEKEQKRFIVSIQGGVEFLTSRFPPVGFFARLDGDLHHTLKEYIYEN